MNILLADDHHLILNALKTIINERYNNTHLYTAINKTELFELLQSYSIDMLIQDIKFGDDNAKDFIAEVKSNYPKLKIIILSSLTDSVTIQYFSKKTDGYVFKSEPIEELIEAIVSVNRNEKYLSKEAQKELNKIIPKNEIILTRKEKEVLKILMDEKSTKEIADILCVSIKTVEMHRANLFVKLDVKNVIGLVKKSISLDLLGN